jgi:hypothetical protein
VRVVKKSVRKQAIAHRAPAAAKPAPARPLVRPGWRDPFR